MELFGYYDEFDEEQQGLLVDEASMPAIVPAANGKKSYSTESYRMRFRRSPHGTTNVGQSSSKSSRRYGGSKPSPGFDTTGARDSWIEW